MSDGESVEITILPDRERVTVQPGETVLAALGRAGLRYRIGCCRRGGCGIRELHLMLAEVSFERTVADSVLSDEEKVEGICVSCRSDSPPGSRPLPGWGPELVSADRDRHSGWSVAFIAR